MGTYNVPRDVSGEDRILFIFSRKALIYTVACAVLGFILYFIFSLMGMKKVGLILMGIFGLIGFLIGTLKVPDIKKFSWMTKNAGANFDDVIRRAFMFKKNKNRIYIYTEEDKTNDK